MGSKVIDFSDISYLKSKIMVLFYFSVTYILNQKNTICNALIYDSYKFYIIINIY